MNLFRRFPFFTAGLALTPIALVIGFVSAGAGHGTYTAARVALLLACLFMGAPFGMVGHFGAVFIITTLALIQWPLYGFLIDRAARKTLAAFAVLLIHGTICFWLFTAGAARFE